MSKVSVLVPVYNVSLFIERCARSLFEQTLDDIEYIFVNDCTPDDSMELLEKVQVQYPGRNVRIISHGQNRGLAVARKTALLAASGDYVCCVDSDDYLDKDMMEVMYEKAVAESADIVVSDIWMEYPDKTEIYYDHVSADTEKNKADMLVCTGKVSPSLCNKMIKRQFWLGTDAFAPDNIRYCEDRCVVTRLYFKARKIVKVDRAFYHYTHSNVNSITHKVVLGHFEDTVTLWTLLDGFLKQEGVWRQYEEYAEWAKVCMKLRLMIDTNSYVLKKKYAFMFRDFELKYLYKCRLGEKMVLCALHYKCCLLAQLFQFLIRIKNKKF